MEFGFLCNYAKRAALGSPFSLSKNLFDKLLKVFKLLEKFENLSLLNVKGNPDGSLSHYPSLRNTRLGRFFDSLKGLP